MNELLNDITQFKKTGTIPNNTIFLANQFRDLLSKTNKEKYKHVSIDPLKLNSERLTLLIDDLKGYIEIPLYKLRTYQ